MPDDYSDKLLQKLLENLEKLFEAKIDTIRTRLDAIDESTKLYREEMKGNMDHLNKVRTEVLQDRSTFVTLELFRSEIDKVYAAVKSNWITVTGWILAILTMLFAYFKP